ncbi:hypothetical protein ACMGD3_22770 [Lysinibacillus sphaericus]|uniref:hypothetical protein n=1 Tax=Lysinibacillus sphaericus TaxID=1421 RepID=UPI001C5D2D52
MENMKTEKIQELVTRDQWIEAFPIMHQLRTALTLERYLRILEEMRKAGYTS